MHHNAPDKGGGKTCYQPKNKRQQQEQDPSQQTTEAQKGGSKPFAENHVTAGPNQKAEPETGTNRYQAQEPHTAMNHGTREGAPPAEPPTLAKCGIDRRSTSGNPEICTKPTTSSGKAPQPPGKNMCKSPHLKGTQPTEKHIAGKQQPDKTKQNGRPTRRTEPNTLPCTKAGNRPMVGVY
ncbi:hypothetical protein NDU88_004144 [Pleurodeles waltl]|uniref:Uncharacterized protein n=1 Tax=Pleurodeles waltl TaxID=8319 RepID=A0AAV7V3V1_PLEWA|nr:hypothetical protein NDU88_004144 [Pleurodeles waltl]